MLRSLLLVLIRWYRQFVSPRKGYSCAYRIHTGHASCSSLGLRAIRRYGALDGLVVLRRRLRRCGVVHRRYGGHPHGVPMGQRGACDAGCDMPCDFSCDVPNVGNWTGGCDCASCAWPTRDTKKRQAEEAHLYIPPAIREDDKAAPPHPPQ